MMRGSILRLLLWAVLCSLVLAIKAQGVDRCDEFRTDVRIAHERYFGLNYPWWYSLGQLKQESRCRANVTAFDGGMGLAQFMPATAANMSKQLGLPLNPYDPEDATRLQAAFLFQLHHQNPLGRLWLTYQAYNGGWTLLLREGKRAGMFEHAAMRKACQRRIIQLKSGPLDFCTVNYQYSELIYRYGAPFRAGADRIPYW